MQQFRRSEAPVLCRVMHAHQKGNYTVSKPNFAVQIIEMSVSFGFTLCALPRGAVGMHNTALTVHERALLICALSHSYLSGSMLGLVHRVV